MFSLYKWHSHSLRSPYVARCPGVMFDFFLSVTLTINQLPRVTASTSQRPSTTVYFPLCTFAPTSSLPPPAVVGISYLASLLPFLLFSPLPLSTQPEWSSSNVSVIMSLFCLRPLNGSLRVYWWLRLAAALALSTPQSHFLLWLHQTYLMHFLVIKAGCIIVSGPRLFCSPCVRITSSQMHIGPFEMSLLPRAISWPTQSGLGTFSCALFRAPCLSHTIVFIYCCVFFMCASPSCLPSALWRQEAGILFILFSVLIVSPAPGQIVGT